MTAEEVKAFIVKHTEMHKSTTIHNKTHMQKVCASRMTAALDGSTDKRKRAMYWLSSATSFTELPGPELLAYRDWLDGRKGFGAVEQAIAKEVQRVYDAAIGAGKGMDKLPGMDEEPESELDKHFGPKVKE